MNFYIDLILIPKYPPGNTINPQSLSSTTLQFWTSPPSVFLVATTVSGQVVGCIAYKQITPDTVQMYRLAVSHEYRGQKIGQKLVQVLLNTAWTNGFDSMYLETTNAQIGAINLYEKMEFKHLHDVPFGPYPWPILEFLSGLKVKAYVGQTNSLSKLRSKSVSESLSNYVNPLAMSAANLRLIQILKYKRKNNPKFYRFHFQYKNGIV